MRSLGPNIKHPQKDLCCQICHATFSDIATLNAHYNDKHTEQKSKTQPHLFCQICSKGYKDKTNLMAHEFTAHGIGQAPRKCKYCDARYAHTNSLKAHIKRDHPEYSWLIREILELFMNMLYWLKWVIVDLVTLDNIIMCNREHVLCKSYN